VFSALVQRRLRFLAAIIGITVLASGCFSGTAAPPPPPSPPPAASGPAAEIVAAVNQTRAGLGLPPFGHNGQLDALARDWSAHMAATGVFAHRNLQATIEQPAFSPFRQLGENILRGGCGMSPREMVDAWMRSPGHRANIASTLYDHIGVGVVCGPDGRVWATQNFGDLR
jgi:uncharacterized protein YkwD